MASRKTALFMFMCGLAAAFGAAAQDPLGIDSRDVHALDSMQRVAEGRPNEEARIAAMNAYIRGDHAHALRQFERAAYFADKYSQHALSLMHWHGVGTPADRVQGYIWADLAAERGTQRLLLVRERMWQDLDETQRAQVRAHGIAFADRYGDRVARPRAESLMRRFATKMTGSRVGFDGRKLEIAGRPAGGIFAPQVGSMSTMYMNSLAATPEQLYGGTRRDHDAYWSEQDAMLGGHVEVGTMTPVRGTTR